MPSPLSSILIICVCSNLLMLMIQFGDGCRKFGALINQIIIKSFYALSCYSTEISFVWLQREKEREKMPFAKKDLKRCLTNSSSHLCLLKFDFFWYCLKKNVKAFSCGGGSRKNIWHALWMRVCMWDMKKVYQINLILKAWALFASFHAGCPKKKKSELTFERVFLKNKFRFYLKTALITIHAANNLFFYIWQTFFLFSHISPKNITPTLQHRFIIRVRES